MEKESKKIIESKEVLIDFTNIKKEGIVIQELLTKIEKIEKRNDNTY